MQTAIHARLRALTGKEQYELPVKYDVATIRLELLADGPFKVYAQSGKEKIPLGVAENGQFSMRRRVHDVEAIIIRTEKATRIYSVAEVFGVFENEELDPTPVEIVSSDLIERQLTAEEHLRRTLRQQGPFAVQEDDPEDDGNMAFPEDDDQVITGYQQLDDLEMEPSPPAEQDDDSEEESSPAPKVKKGRKSKTAAKEPVEPDEEEEEE